MHGTVIEQINSATGDTPTTTKEIYTWQQKSGQRASSTGTIYGIYDLSGGVWERLAAYIANGNESLTSFGKSLLYNESPTEEKSTKYVTVYAHDPNEGTVRDIAGGKNYELEINKKRFGNAMHETSTAGSGWTSWRGDYSYFVGFDYPFSVCGGGWGDGTKAGLFAFFKYSGSSSYHDGFRVVLVGM